jgi:lysophospholipase L1-like esterase
MMLTLRVIVAAISLLLTGGIALADETPKPAAAASKWEMDIAAFEEQDRKSPPEPGGIVFYGSSSIRLWDVKKSFPGLPTINRGFGGSQMADAVQFARRAVTPLKPRTIVLYEGDNDLAANKTPQQVAADFEALMKIIRRDLPDARLIVIGCKPSPARWKLIDKQRQLNRLLADRCAKDEHATFLDVESPMLNPDGLPRDELFREDKLHLTDAGYELWTSLLAPLLNAK